MGIKLVIPPTAVDVMLTEKVQLLFAVMLTPLRATEVPLAAAATVPPVQVVEAAGVEAIFMPFKAAPAVPSIVK